MVGIVVDQLRTDYIEQLQDLFGKRGFRTLLHDGVYLRDVDYNATGLDQASATATAMTGAAPAFTGVPAAMVFDGQSASLRPALAHLSSAGTINNDSFSPEDLRLSTIADEFAVDNNGNATIYSIAADPQQAVILAGHAANGAVWLNNTSGLWATSSYYGALPTAATRANLRSAVAHKVDTMVWRPAANIGAATGVSYTKSTPFCYKFSSKDRDVYRKVALSPMGNAAVTDMAIDLISQMPSGAANPGMLNIGYTLAPYRYGTGDLKAETADAYLKLDSQIGRLLDAVDRYCGAGNAVVWLTSTGYYDAVAVDEKRYRIPGGEFSVRRARSLLNSYLVARYGNGEYVSAIRNGHVYLDTKSLESRRLDPAVVAEEAREFLARMSGVAQTYTRRQILSPDTPELRRIHNTYDPKLGGDILISLAPGWAVTDDNGNTTKSSRHTPVMTPAFILAPGLPARKIDKPVEGVELAPTLTGILRIRPPNGALSRPLPIF